MPIAKEVLKIGFTVAALPGGYISQEAVDKYGWADQVSADSAESVAPTDKDDAAPKGPPQKGA